MNKRKYKTKIADKSMETHIVAWSSGSLSKEKYVDHWEAFENIASAKKRYAEVLKYKDTDIAFLKAVLVDINSVD